MHDKGGQHLFESSWKNPYTSLGIRKFFEQYSRAAGVKNSISPH
jgi:site-specific recombinase XerD